MNKNYGPPSYPPPPPLQTGSALERQTSTHLQMQTPSPQSNSSSGQMYAPPPPAPQSPSPSVGVSAPNAPQQRYAPPTSYAPPPPSTSYAPPPPATSYAPPPPPTSYAPPPATALSNSTTQNGIGFPTQTHNNLPPPPSVAYQSQMPSYHPPQVGSNYAAPSSSAGSYSQDDSLDTTMSKGTRCLDGSMFMPSQQAPPPASHHYYQQQHHHQQQPQQQPQQQHYNSNPSSVSTNTNQQYSRTARGNTNQSSRQPPKSNARIDPSQMPRPLPPATELHYNTRGGNSFRKVPPYTNDCYQALDTGNATPRHMRMTTCAPPGTTSIHKQIKVPMACITTPFASPQNGEAPVPTVSYPNENPPRCTRCMAYINCSVKWENQGNDWVCNLCHMTNATPPWYYSSLDGAGLRRDRDQRPELCKGSVDFVVKSEDYCTRPLQKSNYVFGIDVSTAAVESGFTIAAINAVRSSINLLAAYESKDVQHYVGIFTFHAIGVQHYQCKPEASNPIRVFQSEVDDPAGSLPHSEWILPVISHAKHFELILDLLPRLLQSFNREEKAFGASSSASSTVAIRSVQQALSPGRNGGTAVGANLYLITQCAAGNGYGRVGREPRESMNIYNNERGAKKEFSLYCNMETAIYETKEEGEKEKLRIYSELSIQCSTELLSVHILYGTQDFSLDLERFTDTALLLEITSRTGGDFHIIRGVPSSNESTALVLSQQLCDCVVSMQALEAVCKLRSSLGIRGDTYIGGGCPVLPYSSNEVDFASMNSSTTLMYVLKHDGVLKEDEMCYVQLAVLYTSLSGQRRVRVHNMAMAASLDHKIIFKHTDLDAVAACLSKMALSKALAHPLNHDEGPLKYISNMLVEILAKYRIHCSSQSSASQLILPEALKTLPLYMLGLLKHPALIENKGLSNSIKVVVRAQERAIHIRNLMQMSVHQLINTLYPKLYPLHAMTDGDGLVEMDGGGQSTIKIPPTVSCTSEVFESDGVYLMDDNDVLWLYIGRSVSQRDLEEWFNVHAHQGRPPNINFQTQNSDLAKRMENVIECIREKAHHKQDLKVIWAELSSSMRQEYVRFTTRLVEDSVFGNQSYVDFLCKMHSKIKTLPKTT